MVPVWMVASRWRPSSGQVLATDISPAILAYAAKTATEAGLTNITTLEADGEQLDLPEASYDAAISRVGLIYFPDQQAALTRIRHALRPGGRMAAVVYSTPTATSSSPSPSASSDAAPDSSHRHQASPAPSASVPPASHRRSSPAQGSATSSYTSSPHRSASPVRPNACASKASPSTLCTR